MLGLSRTATASERASGASKPAGQLYDAAGLVLAGCIALAEHRDIERTVGGTGQTGRVVEVENGYRFDPRVAVDDRPINPEQTTRVLVVGSCGSDIKPAGAGTV